MEIRVPGIIALFRTDDAHTIAEIGGMAAADREFAARGPLFNRLIARRIRTILQVDDRRLPGVAPRDYPGRAERQAALVAQLDAEPPDAALASELAAHVLGLRQEKDLGPLLQAAVGLRFDAGFTGGRALWTHGGVFDEAPRDFNPFRILRRLSTGAVKKARATLAASVGNDPAGVHAIAIAVRSLKRSVQAMHALAVDRQRLTTLEAAQAVRLSLCPPETIVRQMTQHGELEGRTLASATICQLELDKAYRAALAANHADADALPFMGQSWSRCPAEEWVRSLLAAAWTQAVARAAGDERVRLGAGSADDLSGPRSAARAAAGAKRFRTALGLRLALDLALALACLVVPGRIAALLVADGGAAVSALTRMTGLLLGWTALLQWHALVDPVRWRWPVIGGLGGRGALAVGFGLIGFGLASKGLAWLALFDLAFLALLLVLYYRLFTAVLQSRP